MVYHLNWRVDRSLNIGCQFPLLLLIKRLPISRSSYIWISYPSTVLQAAQDQSIFFVNSLISAIKLMNLLQVGPRAVELALKSFSQIDGLIINHGTLTPVKRTADFKPEEWRSVFDVNFFSAIALVSSPHLVTNTILTAVRSSPPSPPSASHKAALSSPRPALPSAPTPGGALTDPPKRP
jgi:hypothetical protein